jgi:hypothetical protein
MRRFIQRERAYRLRWILAFRIFTRHKDRGHSSGTPALRRPAKYVESNKRTTFGTP